MSHAFEALCKKPEQPFSADRACSNRAAPAHNCSSLTGHGKERRADRPERVKRFILAETSSCDTSCIAKCCPKTIIRRRRRRRRSKSRSRSRKKEKEKKTENNLYKQMCDYHCGSLTPNAEPEILPTSLPWTVQPWVSELCDRFFLKRGNGQGISHDDS